MDGRLVWLASGLVVVAAAASLWPAGSSRIVDVRVDQQDRYDRLVITLDRPAPIVRRPETEWSDLIVDLQAVPRRSREDIRAESARVGTLTLEQTPSGVRLSASRRDRRLRVFQLEAPPRLVVDFADRYDMVLSVPSGATYVPTVPLARPELAFKVAEDGRPVAGLDLSDDSVRGSRIDPDSALDPDSELQRNPPSAGGRSEAGATGSQTADIIASNALVADGLHDIVAPSATPSIVARYSTIAKWMIMLPLSVVLAMLLASAARYALIAFGVLADPEKVFEQARLVVRERRASGALADSRTASDWAGRDELLSHLVLQQRVEELQMEVRELRAEITKLEGRSGPRLR